MNASRAMKLERVADLRAVTHFLKNWLRMTHRKIGALLCLLLALFIGIYSWSPLIEAKWSMIDDHDIFEVIGQRERLPFSEIPKILLDQTKMDMNEQRYTPTYYALNLLQASVFGKKPAAWYVVHIIIALIFSVVLAIIGLHFAAPVVVFGFVSYELSQSYWGDIFARLGATEAYAALGISLCAVGVMLGLRKKFTGAVCAAIAVGIAIAAGAKENFVLLGLVPVWVLTMRASMVTIAGKLWLLSAFLYSATIAIIVLLSVHNAGHDFYHHPVSFKNTLHLITGVFQETEVWIWILGSALFWLIIELEEHKGVLKPAISQTLKEYLAAAVILLLVYMSQFVFYSGKNFLNNDPRYLFPLILARDVSILIASTVVIKLIVEHTGRASWGAVASITTAVCFLFATTAT